MRIKHLLPVFLFFVCPLALALPSQIQPPGEKLIYVDPASHVWGAYTPDGNLIKQGKVSGGRAWCPDIHRPCKTLSGQHRIRTLGGPGCKSPSFPRPHGGAPMPYCMYYTSAQALHGSYNVGPGNISHGCVRMHVGDAKWLRFNFANVGTLIYIAPY